MRFSMKYINKTIISIITVLILIFNSGAYSAVVSDNDGSAFISKAEFDSLKNNFQSQLDAYNTSIDAKIDSAISSYLAGIKIENEEQCALMLSDFRFPLQILDENPTYIQENIDNDALIYTPKESYLITMTTLNANDVSGKSSDYPLNFIYKFELPQDKNGRSKNLMFNITSYDEDEGLISEMYDDFEDEISYNFPIGQSHIFVPTSGRGVALAFDESGKTTTGYEYLTNHTRQYLIDNYSTHFVPSTYNKQSTHIFPLRLYLSYSSNRNDAGTFISLDDWYGSSTTYELIGVRSLANVFPNLIDVSEKNDSKKNKISLIQNNSDAMLPVVYNGKIKLMNHKNWRSMARLNRNASTYNFKTFRSECGSTTDPYQQNSYVTGINPNFTAELQTVARAGWGVTAEGKKSTLDWYDYSLVKASHLYYQVTDNRNSKNKIKVPMTSGIPLWHVGTKDGNATLNITLEDFDTTQATPKLYVAKNELKGVDASTFRNLYRLSNDKVTYSDSLELSPGENVIHIENIQKDDIMYFKILHGSDEDIIIKSIPSMKFTSIE